jgi:hypothetical protein
MNTHYVLPSEIVEKLPFTESQYCSPVSELDLFENEFLDENNKPKYGDYGKKY